jgi:hypothetical protein
MRFLVPKLSWKWLLTNFISLSQYGFKAYVSEEISKLAKTFTTYVQKGLKEVILGYDPMGLVFTLMLC